MKIIFKVIKARSGNDVYFERLSKALESINIESEIEYYPKIFQFVPILLKIFNKHSKGDIIHSSVEYGWLFKERNKPLFITLHHNVFNNEHKQFTSFAQKIYYNFILKSNIVKSLKIADKIIAVSNYTKNSFIKTFGNYPINVIHNFIDTQKYAPENIKSNDGRFKLLFVGNLIRRKGADLLPRIMLKLGRDYVLSYTSGLRSKKEFDLPNMTPLGKLTERELIDEYNKCDALLFPTRLEGFGYVVAEAMACGKPIIATNSSSIPELVIDGKNGYLCNIDDVNVFVNKIKLLKSDKNFKQKCLKSNMSRIENIFSKNIIIKMYKASYQKYD